MYETATHIEGKGFQMLGARIAQTYRNILDSILTVGFEVEIPLIDEKIDKTIGLGAIVGYPDFSKQLQQYEEVFKAFTNEWQAQLKAAGQTHSCDAAALIAEYGNKLASKIPKF
jgi:hypothetical protein